MSFQKLVLVPLFLLFSVAMTAGAAETHVSVLVTAVKGQVFRLVPNAKEPVSAFSKLKTGDLLELIGDAQVQLVFFGSQRQELWSGNGKLEIESQQGKGTGLPQPQVKTLPEMLVRQIAKTPSIDSQGRAGVVRLRSIPTPEALTKLEEDYRRLRMEAARDDLNPELFLLAGLLEMRELNRVEQTLKDMQATRPNNMEVKVLVSLYRKTLQNLREKG